MIKAPNVQSRARKEIDEQTGRKRLPDLNDRISMPYIECIMKETMRSVTALHIVFQGHLETNSYLGGIQCFQQHCRTGAQRTTGTTGCSYPKDHLCFRMPGEYIDLYMGVSAIEHRGQGHDTRRAQLS